MNNVGGYGDGKPNEEYTMPAIMFNTGMIVCQTQNQCKCFESSKNKQVLRSPRFNQMYAGDSVNDGGWQ